MEKTALTMAEKRNEAIRQAMKIPDPADPWAAVDQIQITSNREPPSEAAQCVSAEDGYEQVPEDTNASTGHIETEVML